jgi:hypothetical protein
MSHRPNYAPAGELLPRRSLQYGPSTSKGSGVFRSFRVEVDSLAPPLYKGEVDEKAPLKEWSVLHSFGTVTECSQWLSVLLHKASLDPAMRMVVSIVFWLHLACRATTRA